MRRRTALATAGTALAGLSGCLDSFRREDAWRELVVDPPDGVYVPPHADGMVRYGTASADGREVSLLASRPHSFWIVADNERSRADIRSHHDVHLMATVRDAATGAFVPAPVTTAVRPRDGSGTAEPIDERSLWPMLSQRMGPHYGDNVSLEGEGRYTAAIRVGASSAAVTGDLPDGLEDEARVAVDFEYDADEIEGLERRLIDEDEGRGAADALEPMDHAVYAAGGDDRDRESSTDLGTATSGDVEYVATLIDDSDRSAGRTRGAGVDRPTLAVTVRTAYNGYPLPFAGLTAAVTESSQPVASAPLRERLDARVGHCYGVPVEPSVLERGDELRIDRETPPQVARHEGYETAFLEGDSVTMALDAP